MFFAAKCSITVFLNRAHWWVCLFRFDLAVNSTFQLLGFL